jgi:polysaccharide pyruvyl transferase WcaK-like protein
VTAFVWATGQDDNIGDSLLRRGYVDALRRSHEVVVWVGRASPAFLGGLGVHPADTVLSSYRQWYLRAAVSALRGRTVVAVNAGEVPVSRMGSLRMASLFFLIALARARGGRGVWLGAGVPSSGRGTVLPYRAVSRAASVVRVRDHESQRRLGGHVGVMPDWAFGLGAATASWIASEQRRQVAVSLRGDRPVPPADWFEWLVKLDLEPVIVVQVERDRERGREVSLILGVAEPVWLVDHAAQEAYVRSVYANCAVAVSDRLHVLIVAATEGALPVGWVPSSGGKVARHFDSVRLHSVGAYEGAVPDVYGPVDLTLAELASAIDRCRVSLDEATLDLAS